MLADGSQGIRDAVLQAYPQFLSVDSIVNQFLTNVVEGTGHAEGLLPVLFRVLSSSLDMQVLGGRLLSSLWFHVTRRGGGGSWIGVGMRFVDRGQRVAGFRHLGNDRFETLPEVELADSSIVPTSRA